MDKILFICIGNSKIIGDSLGPLVGSIILKNKNQMEKNTKIEVLGTITSPLVYSKIETAIEQIIQSISTTIYVKNPNITPKGTHIIPRMRLPKTHIITGILFFATIVGLVQSYLGNL